MLCQMRQSLGVGKWTPANEITVNPNWSCQGEMCVCKCVSLLNSLRCNYKPLHVCVFYSLWVCGSTQSFSNVFHTRLAGGFTVGRPCGLPLQQL